ncbi:MAG TPA: Xaa-Pro peptidase family protein, partial [Candidatus Limnocylindrales bacterium]|nr:Xaa-Pro peptidase family protein [Candidatus Limnocylindrales bacterium]
AARLTAAAGLDALLIGVGADLRYLTGYAAMPLERLTMLALPARGAPVLVVPRLEISSARASAAVGAGLLEVLTTDETEDAIAILVGRLAAELGRPAPELRRLAINDRLWAAFLLRLQAALPTATFELATTVTRQLRMAKDDDEVALLRLAAEAADRVIGQVSRGHLIGRTEADVSREIRERLVAEGHEQAEFAIVGSGPNSASPHHEPSERRIRAGEPVVLDIGGTVEGYTSDTTRTIWVGGGDPATGPDPDFLRLYEVLQAAQAAASAAVRPGIGCQELDATARSIITDAGYGPNFFHRLGHGIGLEAHEEPYLVAGNDEPLRAGYAFSVEPGIYLEGRYGARLEDIVVCGPAGPMVLNRSPLDLQVVDGR